MRGQFLSLFGLMLSEPIIDQRNTILTSQHKPLKNHMCSINCINPVESFLEISYHPEEKKMTIPKR